LAKTPISHDDKRHISRTIICILTPNDKANNAKRKQQSAINFAKEKARELITKSIEELSVLTDQILPSVTFEIPNYYRDSPTIIDEVSEIFDRASSARGCIFQIDIEDRSPPDARRKLGISHFVAIQIANSDGGWSYSDGISSVRVATTVEKLPLLIHDIALDIAMFHSWPLLEESYGSSLDQKIEFSKLKAAFVLRKSRDSHYGRIHNSQLGYFSLATYSRKDSAFSARDYVRLWEEFVNDEIIANQPAMLDIGALTLEPIEQILRFHHQRGQISRRKLAKQLAGLTPDTYLFLMTRKRPSLIKVRNNLAALFGRKKYRQGLWKIVPFRDYKVSERFLPFISLFKFTVGSLSKSVRKT